MFINLEKCWHLFQASSITITIYMAVCIYIPPMQFCCMYFINKFVNANIGNLLFKGFCLQTLNKKQGRIVNKYVLYVRFNINTVLTHFTLLTDSRWNVKLRITVLVIKKSKSTVSRCHRTYIDTKYANQLKMTAFFAFYSVSKISMFKSDLLFLFLTVTSWQVLFVGMY